MAPEYSKAALGLYPLVPSYAVDCDDDANKALCQDEVRIVLPVEIVPLTRENHVGSPTFPHGQSKCCLVLVLSL